MTNEGIFKIVANLDIEKLKNLIDKDVDLNIHLKYSPYPTLLQFAISVDDPCEKSLTVVRTIIDAGIDIETWDLKNYENALLTASRYKNESIVKLLLKKGANPSVLSTEGNSPLREFVKSKSHKIVELLLNCGANKVINTPGGISGMTPLGIAVNNCDIEMVELLLKHGANPLQEDNQYMVPMERFPKDLLPEVRKSISNIITAHVSSHGK